jgi:Delta7-sterol 5-desaturase
LNVLFGLVGHLGVEPFPKAWVRLPLIRLISTSTFHAEHHGDRHHNFGFYTLIWDRLFGTISPDYLRDFERAQGSSTHG